ncbi:MAG: TIGR03088 family PEP-CTERM/XrtA system glycosyltransferase [Pseudomonadota bacterium]
MAHVIFRLDVGGLENGLVNLINRMKPARYRHAIVCIDDYSNFAKRIQRDDVELFALHKKPGADPALHLKFWRLMRRLKPAIVHTRNIGALEYLVPAAVAGVSRRVHGLHGWDMSDLHGTNPRYRWLNRIVRPFVSRYVVLSQDLGNWLSGSVGVPEVRMAHICNGVDTARFAPGNDATRWPDDAFNGNPVTADTVVIGWVGRMQTVKHPVLLARAFAKAASESALCDTDVRLAMIGDGPLRAEAMDVLKSASLAERTWLPGARDDIPGLMRGMSVFALPSLNEGISNTVLEAMASGLPVVATDVGGNPELIQAGRTGELVPADDVEAFSTALVRYAADSDRVHRHGEAARQRAVSEFSLDVMVDRYAGLYDSLF